MLGLIKILNDSVVLYQNWIHEDEWEHIYSFPHGGLTFKIANDNIKFFATKDYFYRNLICSFDLPVHIIDELNNIDGDYSDEEEIAEILNRIYPLEQTSGIDLGLYLQKDDAERLYQPKGNYIDEERLEDFYDKDDVDNMLDGFYTKQETDILLDQKADADDVYTKAQSDAKYQPKGDYVSATTLNSYYTKAQSDNKYQPKGNYLTEHQPIKTINHQSLIGTGNINVGSGGTIEVDSTLSTASTNPVENRVITNAIKTVSGNTYTKTEADAKFISQIKTINNQSLIGTGNIEITSTTITVDDALSPTSINPVQNRIIYDKFVDYYDKTNSDARFQPKGNYVTNATLLQYINNLQTQINSLVETIEDCCSATAETIYRWITMTGATDYVCSGTSKYAREKRQYSNDNGVTWQDVSPAEYRTGDLIEEQSTDCGYIPPQYRWVETASTVCDGYDKRVVERQQVSYDGGQTWRNTSNTRNGRVIESNSYDCGYVGNPKIKVTNSLGNSYQVNCNSNSALIQEDIDRCEDKVTGDCKFYYEIGDCVTHMGSWSTHPAQFAPCTISCTIPESVVYMWGNFENCKELTGITLPSKLKTIQSTTFKNCTKLTNISIPSGVTYIGTGAFYGCSGLTSITCNATTPPTLGYTDVFDNTNNCPIYVPAASVNAYKTATNWSNYASRITAIP